MGYIKSSYGRCIRFWDGSINGVLAPQGTYTYQMLYTLENGLVSNKTGTLYLLR